MPRAGAAIDRILRHHGDQVPFYVFGHTHAAERSSLGTPPADATYLNTGTWSELMRGDAIPQTFVAIEVEPSRPPVAALLAWDDELGAERPVEAEEKL
jgi:predicted phosphodiesterase